MAEFPIFEGTGGGAETTVRTSRIGPEPPEPTGIHAASEALNKVADVLNEQHKAGQQLLLNSAHAAGSAAIADFQTHQEQVGWNQNWETDYKKNMSDSVTKIAKSMSDSGADAATISRFQNQFNVISSGKMPELGRQQIRLLNTHQQGMLDMTLATEAQHSLVGDPMEHISSGLKAIQDARDGHVITDEQAYTRQIGFMNKVAMISAEHDIAMDPHKASKLFSDPANLQGDMIYSHLTPAQVHGEWEHANQLMAQREKQGDQWLKQWKDAALNDTHDMMTGAKPVDYGKLDQYVREDRIPKGLYFAMTGKKAPSNPGLRDQILSAMDTAERDHDRDGIEAAWTMGAASEDLSPEDKAVILRRHSDVMHNFNNNITSAKAVAKADMGHLVRDDLAATLNVTDMSTRSFNRILNKVSPELNAIVDDYKTRIAGATEDPVAIRQLEAECHDKVRQALQDKVKNGTIQVYSPEKLNHEQVQALATPSAGTGGAGLSMSPSGGDKMVAPMTEGGSTAPKAETGDDMSMPVPTGAPTPQPAQPKPATLRDIRAKAYSLGVGR